MMDIITDLEQQLQAARAINAYLHDQIMRLEAENKHLKSLPAARVAELEAENARLKAELEAVTRSHTN